METKNAGLRPNWSESFPYKGVAAVEATAKPVTTQERCDSPPRSLTMRGRAGPTMLPSSEASVSASISPVMTMRISRGVAGARSVAAGVRARSDGNATSQRTRKEAVLF